MRTDQWFHQSQIILVEDNPNLLKVYEKYFELVSLRVNSFFDSGKEAARSFPKTSAKPNENSKIWTPGTIAIIDYAMPEMDGLETARLLKELDPNSKIILMGGRDIEKINLEEKKIDAVLQKPFTISELLLVINHLTSFIERYHGSMVFEDNEDIRSVKLEVLSSSKEKLCLCGDSYSPEGRILGADYEPIYLRASTRGVKIQCITEIKRDNLYYCKRLMQQFGVQLRHVDGLKMNFTIADGRHYLAASVITETTRATKQAIYSNDQSVVIHNQFVFDYLWNKSVPAEQKIQELEFESNERSQVMAISGLEENTKARIRLINNSRTTLDACYDSRIAATFFSTEISENYRDAIIRGVKSRHITEITKENLKACKKLVEIGIELRHLPGVVGAFAVNDVEFDAKATSKDPEVDSESIYSNHQLFVEQHRAIFNTFWNIAEPANIRISELEEEVSRKGDRQEKIA